MNTEYPTRPSDKSPRKDASFLAVFTRIGVLSFGGPAAQIAVMHRELVEERPWMGEDQFLRALSFCMLLPGPEAMQLATYAGWLRRGMIGGVVAGLLFVLPGACVIAALALLYAHFATLPQTEALMLGIKALVMLIVLQALVKLSRKALKSRLDYGLALCSFAAIFLMNVPFPVIIAAAGLCGWIMARGQNTEPQLRADTQPLNWRLVVVWALLWLAPIPILWMTGQTFLFQISVFFSKLAITTFGGAYAVLAYMAQQVVETHHWLSAPQMVDALGLAETTPGPLILVTQFVAMLAGHSEGGVTLALVAGAVTLWMTFMPCFLWIFTAAPHVESLLSHPRLRGALQAITAAVVGVIANLSLWFALHVIFAQITPVKSGPFHVDWPVFSSLDVTLAPLIVIGAICLFVLKKGILFSVLVCAVAGMVLPLFTL